MSLDLLISKYLDGELNLEEDKQLRELLKEDPNSKSEFDAAVILNAAFKEDAESLKAPADIVSETEDLILMRILNTPKAAPSVVKHQRRYRYRTAVAFLLAVAIIGGVFSISEISQLQFADRFAQSVDTQTINNIDELNNYLGFANNDVAQTIVNNEQQPISEIAQTEISSNNTIRRKAALSTKFAEEVNINNEVLVNSSREIDESQLSEVEEMILDNNEQVAKQIIAPVESKDDAPAEAKDIAMSSINEAKEGRNSGTVQSSEPALTYQTSRTNDAMKQDAMTQMNIRTSRTTSGALPNNVVMFDPFNERTDIILTTFFGTDLTNRSSEANGKNPINIYSQSISYGFSKKSRIGLEVGSIEYDYDFYTYVRVPTSIAPTSSVEGLNPIGTDDGYFFIPISLNRRAQTYWGAALWDYELYNTELFALQSRLAIGASGDGMLVFARLFGQVNVYRGFYITLGTEARGFDGKINSNRRGFIGTSSIIYGLQFKF